jgi:predicted RNase H-like nuclease (RuvC/YqgF family)
VEIRQFENRLAKLRKELSGKETEIERLSKKTTG